MGVGVERFFLGPGPVLRSFDSDDSIRSFPIITASVSYENQVLAFIEWLKQGGIPPLRRDRVGGGYPLIGAGGALTYINPLSLFDVCDFIVLGDGEVTLKPLVQALRSDHHEGVLRDLATTPNILVPHHPSSNLEVAKSDHISVEDASSAWIAPNGVFGDSVLLELQRGCRRACRFCTLTYCFSPLRRLPLEEAVGVVERKFGPFRGWFGRIGLITPEAGDYPGLRELVERILAMDMGISFASLRLDSLDPFMIRALSSRGGRSLTLAPEAGSLKLRLSCGKNFTDDMIVEKALLAKREGMGKLKLYFMLGLPGEEDQDLEAIGSLCGRILRESDLPLVVSLNAFVPKPGTPWGGASFIDKRTYDRRSDLVRRSCLEACGRRKLEIRFNGYREALREYQIAWALPGDIEGGLSLPDEDRKGRLTQTLERMGYGVDALRIKMDRGC